MVNDRSCDLSTIGTSFVVVGTYMNLLCCMLLYLLRASYVGRTAAAAAHGKRRAVRMCAGRRAGLEGGRAGGRVMTMTNDGYRHGVTNIAFAFVD